MSKIAVLALMGYLSATQAQELSIQKEIESCKSRPTDLTALKTCHAENRELEEFRYFIHANEYMKDVFQKWWEENQPDDDDDQVSDSSSEDQDAGKTDSDSHLPVLSKAQIQQQVKSGRYRQCDGAVARLLNEGKSRILVEGGDLYNDVSFPASGNSIDRKKNDDPQGKLWIRPDTLKEYNEEVPSIWGNEGIRPAAIRQGGLGDCWLLAAMAAIGEEPSRIRKLFKNKRGFPTDGKLTLALHAYGEEYNVHIDTKLPSRRSDQLRTRFTHRSRNQAWWATYAEKAAAKYYGDYQIMSGGWMNAGIAIYTGEATYDYRLQGQSPQQVWDAISKFDEDKQIMTVSVGKVANSFGLVNYHAYTLLGVTHITNKQGQQQRAYVIRNPWGVEKYNGELLYRSGVSDGRFLMSEREFNQLFNMVHVTDYNHDLKKTTFKTHWDRSEDFRIKKYEYLIKNPVEQDVKIGFASAQKRMFTCAHEKQTDNMLFRFYKLDEDTGKVTQWTDSHKKFYTWLSSGTANEAFQYEKLPKGTWILKTTQSVRPSVKTGKFDFSIYGKAANEAVDISVRHPDEWR